MIKHICLPANLHTLSDVFLICSAVSGAKLVSLFSYWTVVSGWRSRTRSFFVGGVRYEGKASNTVGTASFFKDRVFRARGDSSFFCFGNVKSVLKSDSLKWALHIVEYLVGVKFFLLIFLNHFSRRSLSGRGNLWKDKLENLIALLLQRGTLQ